MIGLNPEAPPWRRYVVERVRVLILPPPVRVRLTLITEAGQPLDLEPLEARLELPGPPARVADEHPDLRLLPLAHPGERLPAPARAGDHHSLFTISRR